MLYVKAWSWNNVNSLIKNVNCFTLVKPIGTCYLSLCVVFILENRQKFRVRVHVKASSVNCHSKDVDSSDCDLCTLVNSELFELWTWVCLASHLYPQGRKSRGGWGGCIPPNNFWGGDAGGDATPQSSPPIIYRTLLFLTIYLADSMASRFLLIWLRIATAFFYSRTQSIKYKRQSFALQKIR